MPLELPANDPLQLSLTQLRGLTPPRLAQLNRLGLHTIRDLLFHFPRSYEDLTEVRPISDLKADLVQTVRGEVVEIDGDRLPDGRTVVRIVLGDGKMVLEGVWFNQPYAANRYRYGQWLAFSGKAKWYRDHWQMSHPRVQVLDDPTDVQTPGVVPVYPMTEDLRPEVLRTLIRRTVERFAHHLVEVLPGELRKKRALPMVHVALHDVHEPPNLTAAQAAQRRFVYEEFLLLQLALALRRRDLRDRQQAPKLPVTPEIDVRIRRRLPFKFTADQDRAVAEICHDLASDRPMQRLLQADVGAGKTAVAVYALLVTVANKHQAALMAPTEVLARQHWHTLEHYLANSRVRRLLLTGALTSKGRRQALEAIRQGEIDLVVGTQALVQEDVQFARLGLVVIDEQHKFGVNQRARVRRLGAEPHYLVMTATPIPRTVALTVFGDLDVSIIKQLPPGRQPVTTRWMPAAQRERVYEQLRQALQQGRQAYVVCPLVAESENLDCKAAEKSYQELRQGPFQGFNVGLLHGRMNEDDKDRVMSQFRRREIDLLVSTSVVEVGVDVPNATLMVIEHADRFGLSQLHQLRGRISRGSIAGQCFLFAEAATEDAELRLRILCRTTDGFALAEEDARLRGLGEFFGTRQHGLGELRFGDLLRDAAILQQSRQDAIALVAADAGLRQPDHALLRRAVLERYGQTLDLAAIG